MSKGIRSVSRTLFGGSDSSSQQSAQQSSQLDSRVFDLMQENYNRAKAAAYGQPTRFGFTRGGLKARRFADFSPLQNQGFSFLSNINNNAGIGAAQNALGQLNNMQFGADRIDPMMVSGQGFGIERAGLGGLGAAQGYGVANASAGTLGDAARVNAGSFLTGNINAYMNPYTSAVIDQSMSDIDRARQMQQQGINAQALSRGAFGGSRQAIAEAENNRNFMDQQARTISGLRQQGFDTAAGLMQSDLNRDLQAQSQNQAAQNQFALQRYGTEADINQFNAANQTAANQFLAGAQNQFGLTRFGAENDLNRFNAANQTAANQFGAEAINRANLANQAAGLTAATQNANNQLQAQQSRAGALSNALTGGLNLNQSFLGNINAQMQAGAMQQQLEQQRLDAIRNLPLEQLQITSGALGLNPFGGAGNVSQGSSQGTSRAGSDPGLLGGFVGLFK